MSTRTWKLLRSPLFIFLVALALRLGGLTYFRFVHATPAARDYWGPAAEIGHIAASVARGRGFSSPYWAPTGPTAQQPPVFPYLIAGVFKLFGIFSSTSAFVVLAVDCVFSALTSVLILLTGKRIFGATVGILSAWVWVFWPAAALTPVTHMWHDSLSALLLTAAFLMTLRLKGSSRIGGAGWAGLGLLWGVAGLTDPALLAPMPFLLAWLCFRRRRQGRPWAKGLAGVVAIFFLTIFPWLLRNYFTFGRPMFIIDDFGMELHVGNHPGVTAARMGPDPLPSDNQAEWEEYRRLGEVRYLAEKLRQGLYFISSHPTTYVMLCVERFGEFWIWTGDDVPFGTILGPFGANLVYFLLPALGVIGLFLAASRRVEGSLPLGLMLCTFPLVYVATAVDPRFRHPIEPEFVLLGTYAATAAAGWLHAKLSPPS